VLHSTSVTIGNGVTSIDTIYEDGTYYGAFAICTSLTNITIPKNVNSIGIAAFYNCTSLTSVTFQGIISSDNFPSDNSFPGDLRTKYLAGDIGTYTRPSGGSTWTKQ
jgi:hypothetical protein